MIAFLSDKASVKLTFLCVILLVGLTGVFLAFPTATVASFTTYDISGTFDIGCSPSCGSFSGTVTDDIGSNLISSFHVQTTASAPWQSATYLYSAWPNGAPHVQIGAEVLFVFPDGIINGLPAFLLLDELLPSSVQRVGHAEGAPAIAAPAAVPEPATAYFLLTGIGGLVWCRCRTWKQAAV